MDRDAFIREMFSCLRLHRDRYPQLQAEDVVKFIFQGMLGVGHLLADQETVERYIAEELWNAAPVADEPLAEPVSPAWCRLNLRPAREEGLSSRRIARLMLHSEAGISFTRADAAAVCRAAVQEQGLPDGFKAAERVGESGWLPSHSEIYRRLYYPAYRIIGEEWRSLLPALCAVAKKVHPGQRILVTLDGPCASGKTTLAKRLADVLEAQVLHTDDFVVPHANKTPERLSVPGGNCDWERLTNEVLAPWKRGENPFFRRYDCRQDCMLPPETLDPERILILEGSYCNLPPIRQYADVRLFMITPEPVRMDRLRVRESPESLKRFFDRWIPLENAYFEAYHLPDQDCIPV